MRRYFRLSNGCSRSSPKAVMLYGGGRRAGSWLGAAGQVDEFRSKRRTRAPEHAALVCDAFHLPEVHELLVTDENRSWRIFDEVSRAVRARRVQSKLTQSDVARELKTSHLNVCKMESGFRDVSLDQICGAFFVVGPDLAGYSRGGQPLRQLGLVR